MCSVRSCVQSRHKFDFWRDTGTGVTALAPYVSGNTVRGRGTNMETLSEVVALPPPSSEGDTTEETRGEVEGQTEEQSEAVEDEFTQTAGTGTVVLTQSTLVPYRTPVLPNLAKTALERLQKRNAGDLEDSPNSDFQPLKRRRVDENTNPEGEENEVSNS